MMTKETVGTDSLQVTDDEAVELTVHHLRLAQLFFQNTPEDGGIQLREEYRRIMLRDGPKGYIPTGYDAGVTWIKAIVAEFEDLKKDQGE